MTPPQSVNPPVEAQALERMVCGYMSKALGRRIEVTTEDRLRLAIIEAATWLRQENAPGRALEVLEKALKQ